MRKDRPKERTRGETSLLLKNRKMRSAYAEFLRCKLDLVKKRKREAIGIKEERSVFYGKTQKSTVF